MGMDQRQGDLSVDLAGRAASRYSEIVRVNFPQGLIYSFDKMSPTSNAQTICRFAVRLVSSSKQYAGVQEQLNNLDVFVKIFDIIHQLTLSSSEKIQLD